MALDFNKTCPVEEHKEEKIPLIGIEPSGAGIRYVFACGHGQIIQVVGGGEKLKLISDKLRTLQVMSIDKLAIEMAEFVPNIPKEELENTLVENKNVELILDEYTPIIKKTICEDLKFCKRVKYYKEIPVPMGLLVAYNLFSSSEGLQFGMILYFVTLFMRLGIDKLKKWCECDG